MTDERAALRRRLLGRPRTAQEKLWGWLVHVSVLITGFIGPLIIWAVYKDRSAWLRDNSREALNFSILSTIVMLVSTLLTIVLVGWITYLIWFVVMLVFCIQAAMAANQGQFYRYPLNWRLVK